MEQGHGGGEKPHLPGPSLWPVGFAIGIACLLIGFVVSWWIVAIGAGVAIVFAGLWSHDVVAGKPALADAPAVEPETRAPTAPPLPANVGEAAMPPPEPGERFPRSRFLEASTLGLGAVIGGVVTVPVAGFMLAPAFSRQENGNIDIGPLSDYPEGQFNIVTFLENPDEGEVSRRTVFVRYNGLLEREPSFTIISNRCVHLGCPVQPNGPVDEEKAEQFINKQRKQVRITPVTPAGFGCPCHGGAYDTEGNRTAGPPVRALDRWTYSIVNGRLVVGKPFSVGTVDGTGADAEINKYELHGPGQHADDWEWWLYPGQPPH